MHYDIWKYCTKDQWIQYLLSMNLTGNLRLSDEKKLALLYELSNHAEEHYTTIRIPKHSGGLRVIRQPDSLLKYIQRQILFRILVQIPVSDCAFAYRKGFSAADNARPHAGKDTVLKLDIHDFYENITFTAVYQHAFPETLFPPPIRTLLTHLCCYDSILPQGAPTSPCISNLVMRPFDETMKQWCGEQGITYTRYCDDMTFSGHFPGNTAREVIDKTRGFLLRLGFELNQKKTRLIRRGCRQEVTGYTVNDRVRTSKDYRRKLRQEWYYIRKFGLEEHLKTLLGTSHVTDAQKNSYLQSFTGRIAHVLRTDPQNTVFLAIQKEVKLMRDS